jgi:hypothetical protein
MNQSHHSSARFAPSASILALAGPNGVLGWWLPLAVILAGLGAIQWLDSENTAPGRVAVAGSRPDAEYWRNLGLMGGNGFLLAWLLALAHWRRLHKAGATARWHGATAGVGGVTLVAVWSLGLILPSRDDLTLALAFFIYAPTLGIAFGLAALVVRRLRRCWPAAAALAGLATLNLLCQLFYLDPAGREPGTAVFALGSLPIAAGVAFWLAAQARPVVTSPIPPAP